MYSGPYHWVQDPQIGGGRIIGEVCHFIDLCRFIADAPVKAISAFSLEDHQGQNDSIVVNLSFSNGSVATVSYFSNGNKSLPKEYLEVFYSGQVFILNDFAEMTILGKKKTKLKLGQDKGHAEEIRQYLTAIKEGKSIPIPIDELFESSILPFKIIESMQTKKTIFMD
jgi:polar amino acid transport system substrate-binding protein